MLSENVNVQGYCSFTDECRTSFSNGGDVFLIYSAI